LSDRPHRREDRILDDSYLLDVESIPTSQLRDRRAECRELESELSYSRRLLQGKADILTHELRRRSEGGAPELHQLIDKLPSILADDPSPSSQSRFVDVGLPRNAGKHRRQAERLATDLANIEELSVDELSAMVDTLTEAERQVSSDRRRAQVVIDGLNAELVRRYREGEEDPSALLSPS
jgi:hypothetical protein